MGFGPICSINHESEGGVNANHNVTCSPSLAENDSRLRRKGRKSRWRVDFLSKEGDRRCFILASDKNEKDQKNLRNSYPRLLPETGRSQSNEP